MTKKKRNVIICVWLGIILLLLMGVILTNNTQKQDENIKEVMRDSVLHDNKKIQLFGIIDINPALISAFIVTLIILVAAAILRIFIIPKFKYIPGKIQLVLESAVGMFDGMAKDNSPRHNNLLGLYIFVAGSYIFIGTLFELVGIQVMTTSGRIVTLPAPLSDINAAIAMGVLSYLFILISGLIVNKWRGLITLKDFSLPISMSFRLFGALLSGLLVTELVYYYISLSFIIPVVVAVLFTLLHALIQTYVLTMLTALFYGEATALHIKKIKKVKNKKLLKADASLIE